MRKSQPRNQSQLLFVIERTATDGVTTREQGQRIADFTHRLRGSAVTALRL